MEEFYEFKDKQHYLLGFTERELSSLTREDLKQIVYIFLNQTLKEKTANYRLFSVEYYSVYEGDKLTEFIINIFCMARKEYESQEFHLILTEDDCLNFGWRVSQDIRDDYNKYKEEFIDKIEEIGISEETKEERKNLEIELTKRKQNSMYFAKQFEGRYHRAKKGETNYKFYTLKKYGRYYTETILNNIKNGYTVKFVGNNVLGYNRYIY